MHHLIGGHGRLKFNRPLPPVGRSPKANPMLGQSFSGPFFRDEFIAETIIAQIRKLIEF